MKRGLWLVGAVLLAYGSAVPGDFVWLDHMEIERGGYRAESVDDLSKLFRYSLDRYLIRDRVQPEEMSGGYFRPVYGLSISADWSLFGARPSLFHAENLLWHALVVLLLYALGQRLFARLDRGDTISFAAALLFAVHPLAIQSVTWISGRKDAMCAAFMVAALLALFRAGEEVQAKRFASWSAAAGAATLLAGLSKELGLLLPLLATGLVWVRLPAPLAGERGCADESDESDESDRRDREIGRRTAQALVALWLPAAALAVHRIVGIGIADLNASRPTDRFAHDLATSVAVLWRYVGAVLLPGAPRLSDAWPVVHVLGPPEWVAMVGMLAAGVLCVAAVLRRGPLSPAIVWLGVLAAPASGLVPLRHFHAERYLYPAYWGLLAGVLIALLHYRLLDRLIPLRTRPSVAAKWGFAALAVIAIATASVTATSNLVWWSDATLFRDAVERDPHYVEGRLGLALAAVQEGRFEQAVTLSRRAIEEANDRSYTAYWSPFVAHLNLAGALDELRRTDEAYSAYREALRYRPDDPRVLCRAGMSALLLSQAAQAKEHLVRAAQIAQRQQGAIGFECSLSRALAHVELAEWSSALPVLEALVTAHPRNLPARRALIRVQLELDRVGEADATLRALGPEAPQRADLQALLAWVLFRQGESHAALQAWQRAHALDPRDPLLWEVAARLESASPALAFPTPPLPAYGVEDAATDASEGGERAHVGDD